MRVFQFRRFSEFIVEKFDPRLNVICGSNALGKTSLLEALSLSTNLHSFRTNKSAELIQEGKPDSLVTVNLEKPTASKVSIGLEVNRKSIFVDDLRISSRSKFPYLGGSISFSPDDLHLIKGAPEARRQFLDELLISLDPAYSILLHRFEKVLKQRNSLLKILKENRSGLSELPLWTQSFIEAAVPIYLERFRAVELLRENLPTIYQQLFNVREDLAVFYRTRFETEITGDAQSVEDLLREKLDRLAEAEMAIGYSLAGPHKDDVEFLLNHLDARTYGSQGQTRGLVIALKISQLEMSRKLRGIGPILLLDDIISELDDSRVRALIHYLASYPGQLFVTTAEVNKVSQLHKEFGSFELIDLAQKSQGEFLRHEIEFV